jgi:hypothetical protein
MYQTPVFDLPSSLPGSAWLCRSPQEEAPMTETGNITNWISNFKWILAINSLIISWIIGYFGARWWTPLLLMLMVCGAYFTGLHDSYMRRDILRLRQWFMGIRSVATDERISREQIRIIAESALAGATRGMREPDPEGEKLW